MMQADIWSGKTTVLLTIYTGTHYLHRDSGGGGMCVCTWYNLQFIGIVYSDIQEVYGSSRLATALGLKFTGVQ